MGRNVWGCNAWGSRLRRDALHGELRFNFSCSTARRRRALHALAPSKRSTQKCHKPAPCQNSKAANQNLLLAHHVGHVAQNLQKFTISQREYFGTNSTPYAHAYARASPKFVHSTFICHLSLRECANVQMCKCANKRMNALIGTIFVMVTANSHEGIKIRHGLKISVMRMYRKR